MSSVMSSGLSFAPHWLCDVEQVIVISVPVAREGAGTAVAALPAVVHFNDIRFKEGISE